MSRTRASFIRFACLWLAALAAGPGTACGNPALAPDSSDGGSTCDGDCAPCSSTGSGGTISYLIRDTGTVNGGTQVRIIGTSFSPGDCVVFGGVPASQVTFVGPTELGAVTPPHAAGDHDVTVVQQNGAGPTLVGGFDYEPAPTSFHVQADFEDGSLGGWRATGGAAVSTEATHSGSRAIKCAVTGTASNSALAFAYANPVNPAASSPTGVYLRWFVMLPQSTLSSLASGQVKLHLERDVSNVQSPERAGWFMLGAGPQFRGPNAFTAFGDFGIFNIDGRYLGVPFTNGDTSYRLEPDVWVEVQTWYRYVNGVGSVKLWLDGSRAISTSSSALGELFGSGDLTAQYEPRIGIVYRQATAGDLTVYLDDTALADGYVE